MIRGLIGAAAIFFLSTFPSTWLLMLFLGNVGVNVSYAGALPLGVIVSILVAGASTPATRIIKVD
jgi:hypothetical protein